MNTAPPFPFPAAVPVSTTDTPLGVLPNRRSIVYPRDGKWSDVFHLLAHMPPNKRRKVLRGGRFLRSRFRAGLSDAASVIHRTPSLPQRNNVA